MNRITRIHLSFLLILLKVCNLYDISAGWPASNPSYIQLLHLVSNVTNASDSNIPSIHSTAMFKAAILLATRYNISIQAHFLTGQIADAAGTETNAMIATCNALSNSNVVGIVGPKYSRETPILAGMCERIGIPIISYSATDAALSDRNAYPAFYRTVPSDSAAALAIAKLFLQYNWTSCIIIYQNDAFGSGGAQAITNALLKNRLQVANSLVFDIFTQRMRDNLRDILTTSSTRIVILWITSPFVATVLQDALDSDVLGPNYVWIISSNFDVTNFDQISYPKLIGLFTLQPAVASAINAPINATLLNAAYDLWKQYEPETFPGPENVDYYASFAFDATWTLILSLQRLCSINTNSSSSCIFPNNASLCYNRHFFDSDALFHIINNITFLGVSGQIQFDATTTDSINSSYYYVAKNAQLSSNGLNLVPVLSYTDYFGWQRQPNTQIVWPGNSLVAPTGRAKLEGITLRMGVIQSIQYTNVQKITDASGNITTQLIGYIPDLIDQLKAQLKFIPDIRLTPAGRTYDNLINDVANGVYDLLLGDVSVTARRREKVDFSTAIFDNSLRILMRKEPNTEIELFNFLKPLSWDLWLLIFGTLILTSILIWILERDVNEYFRHKSLVELFLMGIWFSFCNFIGRDLELQARSGPGRLLSSAMFFLTLVLVASYTANLASELTILKSQTGISGLDDLKNGKIPFNRIGIRVGTASEEYFLSEISGGNANYYPLYSRQQQYDNLLNYAIDVAFLDTGVAQYITNNVYCNLTIVGDGFNSGSFGIAMPKGWLYANDLDVAILLLRESGVLDDLNRKWFQYKQCPDDVVSSVSMGARSLLGLFMLFGIVCILSLLIFGWNKLQMTKKACQWIHRIMDLLNKNWYSERQGPRLSHPNIDIDGLKGRRVYRM